MEGKLQGGAGMHGGDYQIKLYMLFLLRGYIRNKNYSLRAELKKAGKFDDLVFEDDNDTILLQAKHKDNPNKKISSTQMFAEQGEFSLPKYLTSYMDVYQNFSNETTYVICSNIDINEEVFKMFANEIKTHKTSIFCDAKVRSFATTSTEKKLVELRASVPEKIISSFLSNLLFVVFSDNVVEKTIREILEILIVFNKRLNVTTAYDYIYKKLKLWFIGKDQCLTKTHLEAYLSQMSSDAYMHSLQIYCNKIQFSDIPIPSGIQMVMIESSRYVLLMVKFYQQLCQENTEKILIIDPEISDNQEILINGFELPQFTHLLCFIPHNNMEALVRGIEAIHKKIMNKSYKQIIIITEKAFALNDNKNIYHTTDYTFYTDLNLFGIDREYVEDYDNYYVKRHFAVASEFGLGQVYTEGDMLYEVLNDKEEILLISDIAGMGKSTFILNLMHSINRNTKSFWALKINLNAHTRLFQNCVNKNKSLEINELLNFRHGLKKFEKQILLIPEVIILLLDGLDEISDEHIVLVREFVRDNISSHNVKKIVVATRPHVQNRLAYTSESPTEAIIKFSQENNLHVKIFNFVPLREEERYTLIFRQWVQKLEIRSQQQKVKCQEYAKVLLKKLSSLVSQLVSLIGIPLMLSMLAEIFEHHAMNYCIGKIAENEENEGLENWNIARLYKMFIERKKAIYVVEKSNTQGNKITTEIASKTFEEYLTFCEELALKDILQTEMFNFFQANQSNNIPYNQLYDTGIVVEVEGNRAFLHRTFAEYLVAKRLFEEFNSCKQKRIVYIIEHIICWGDYYRIGGVHRFLNSIIENEWNNIEVELLRICGKYSIIVDLTDLVVENHLHILRLFLEKCNKSQFNEDTLKEAVFRENLDAVKYLVQKGANVHFQNDAGETILHQAVLESKLEIVEYLVQRGANLHAKTKDGETVLHYAISTGNFYIVEYLVTQGIDLQAKDKYGETPLYASVIRGYLGLTKFLVQKGADIKTKKHDGRSLLHAALMSPIHCDDLVQYLVENGVNVNSTDNRGESVLHRAASTGNKFFIHYLVKQGANVNIRDKQGKSLLHAAVARTTNSPEIINDLLKVGASLDARDNLGNSILHEAILKRNSEIINCLIEKGIDVNSRNNNGILALHLLVETNNFPLVKYLVEQGANVNAKDNNGTSVLRLAKTANMTKYLVEQGAIVNPEDKKYLITASGDSVNAINNRDRVASRLSKSNLNDNVSVKPLFENDLSSETNFENEFSTVHLSDFDAVSNKKSASIEKDPQSKLCRFRFFKFKFGKK